MCSRRKPSHPSQQINPGEKTCLSIQNLIRELNAGFLDRFPTEHGRDFLEEAGV